MIKPMTEGNPFQLILTFSIPLIIGNIFQQMYNIADVIIVGRTIGVNALAAVGATIPIFMLMFGIAIGLTAGFSVITGQRFGAGDMDGVRRSIATSSWMCGVFTVFSMLTMWCLMDWILQQMNVPQNILPEAYNYIIILSHGIGAMVFYNLLAAILRSLGDSKTPLYFLIVSSVLNVVLALVFIRNFGWGVPGSAIAMVIAQLVSGILCLSYIIKKFPQLHLKKADWVFDRSFVWEHLRMGLPMAVQFTILCLGIIVVQAVCNSFGAVTIAAFSSAMRIEQLALQPMISFGIAIAVYTAQNYGARKFERIRQGVRMGSVITFGFCALAALAVYFLGEQMALLFISDYNEQVVRQAVQYLHLSVPFYFFLGQIFIYRNALTGMGLAMMPLYSSCIELLLRSVAAVFLAGQFGYLGICYASPICWVGASLFLSAAYFIFITILEKKNSFAL